MIKKVLFSFISLLFSFHFRVFATGDSLVYLSDLTFRNIEEKTIYKELNTKNGDSDLLPLFLHITPFEDSSSIDNSKNKIDSFIEGIEKRISTKSDSFETDEIVRSIKSTFLKNYNEKSFLKETILNGNYNCYTATALYGLVFSKLKIPFEINENENSIKIIINPDSQKFEINPDKSVNKCIVYPEHFRNKWTKSAFYAKEIPYEEFEKGYSESLFEKYYYTQSKVNLRQLASIMLCNLSLQASEDHKLQEALYYIQKSYLTDPNGRNKITLKYHIFNALGKYNYEKREDFLKLIYLCRFNNTKDVEITSEFISSEFLRFLGVQLANKTDLKIIEEDYFNLIKISNNLSLKNEISFIYNYEIARMLIGKKSKVFEEHLYLKEAYRIKPEDKDLQSLIFESLNSNLQQIGESEKALKLVNEFCLNFDFLNSNTSISIIKTHCYLDLAFINFSNGMFVEGDSYLKKSEQLCSNKLVIPNVDLIEKGYLSAAKYYFKKGDKLKAKEYLLKGFEYAPDSKLIQDKLKLVQQP